MKKTLSLLAGLLLAVTLSADSTLHPTPPPHPDAVPDGITDLVHPGVMNTTGVNPRWANLVAGWKLDEESDGSGAVTRVDVLGIYDLTDNNTVASDTGKLGDGALFVKTDSTYLSHATAHTSLQFLSTTSIRTIAFWTYWNSVPDLGFSYDMGSNAGGNPATSGEWDLLINYGAANGHYNFRVRGASTTATVAAFVTPAAWHCIFSWYDDSTSKIYLQVDDGTPVAYGSTFSLGTAGATGPFVLGARDTGSLFMDGILDNFYIFSDVKDADWRAGFYNEGAGVAYPN